MHVIDLHCDVLMKLAAAQGGMDYKNELELDASYEKLKKGGVKVQAFAIFIPPSRQIRPKISGCLGSNPFFLYGSPREKPEHETDENMDGP